MAHFFLSFFPLCLFFFFLAFLFHPFSVVRLLCFLLCVHDWVLGKAQHTHCLQICTTSWLSFTGWRGMCQILESAQQKTKGNSGPFWVNNMPGAWVAFWFWEIYDCFWMPYYLPNPHPSSIRVLHGLVCVSTLGPRPWSYIYLVPLKL